MFLKKKRGVVVIIGYHFCIRFKQLEVFLFIQQSAVLAEVQENHISTGLQ